MHTDRSRTVLPIFPCQSIDEQLAFYETLGFEVTYRQSKPNVYACVRHPVVELHFFVLKQLEPSNSYSMCYIHVCDVDAVYKQFCDNWRRVHPKLPTKGFPRISRPNNLAEDRRFHLIDPAGNRLLIGQRHADPLPAQRDSGEERIASPFVRAFETAYRLAYAKDEPAQAAGVLDRVWGEADEAATTVRFQAYVLRADIAAAMGDLSLAKTYVRQAEQLSLPRQELPQVAEAVERLQQLVESWEHV